MQVGKLLVARASIIRDCLFSSESENRYHKPSNTTVNLNPRCLTHFDSFVCVHVCVRVRWVYFCCVPYGVMSRVIWFYHQFTIVILLFYAALLLLSLAVVTQRKQQLTKTRKENNSACHPWTESKKLFKVRICCDTTKPNRGNELHEFAFRLVLCLVSPSTVSFAWFVVRFCT